MTAILETMKAYAAEIRGMLAAGKNLREISKWSFAERRSGRNVPYLAINQTEKDGTVTELRASPVRMQRELDAFFGEKAPGSVLARYTLAVGLTEVSFTERFAKGPIGPATVKNLI